MRSAFVLAGVLAAALVGPTGAAAAVCADFANQAAAQRAANSRDADADGVYCERLPCPCLRPGRSSRSLRARRRSPPAHRATARGSSDLLTRGRCRRGLKADPRCTPGARLAGATRARICTPGYSARVRNVPQSLKREIYAEYGIVRHRPGEYEIDHLIPLELGGSNSARNLWPEPYSGATGASDKDELESRLHSRVCSGAISLAAAQREIVARWEMGRSGPVHRVGYGRRAQPRPAAGPATTSTASPRPASRPSSSDGGSLVGWLLLAGGALYFFNRQHHRRQGPGPG
jgi:hypothetical protein